MTRVLYWNINNFSEHKVADNTDFVTIVQSADRLAHIVNEVLAPNPPDMFVVVECYGRVQEVSFQGNVMNPNANVGIGCLTLLRQMRNTLSATWCLAPPITLGDLGMREGVAVYYNAATLQFTGPYVYSLANGLYMARPPSRVAHTQVGAYPMAWWEALPGPMNPISNALRNIDRAWPAPFSDGQQNLNEAYWAGQFEQFNAHGTRLNFPLTINRSPYLARFWDGTNNRTLKVFGIHTSPGTAYQAVDVIRYIDQVATVNQNEAVLVVGDFNVDSFGQFADGYDWLRANSTMLLSAHDAGNIQPNRKPYCMTHTLPASVTNQKTHVTRQIAYPFNANGVPADPQHNVYPRFGYMGSWIADAISDTGAIDNAFVRYGLNTWAPGNHNVTIVNTVVGKPYNHQNPAPAHVTAELTGGLNIPQRLHNAIPQPAGVNPPVDNIGFMQWQNFGRVRSTSDHLALLMDV